MRNPESNFNSYEKLSYQHVSFLDPLELDSFMVELPTLNKSNDIDTILETLKFAVGYSNLKIKDGNRAGALASLRDIDFLLSSALRHGVDALQEIDGLEPELVRLGEITHTLPRGTVYTYAVANPTGDRRRSFTGSVEEDGFIDAVRESCLALDSAVELLGTSPTSNDESLSKALGVTLEAMQTMTNSIVTVRRSVSPTFFTQTMRPFFEPIVIDGKTITGAGGAQMQMLAIDSILWGMDSPSTEYSDFFGENVQYLTPNQQGILTLYRKRNQSLSVLSHLESNTTQYPKSLGVFAQVMSQIKKFRYPHKKLAEDNFKIRHNDAVGSGQYKPDILDVLIEATEDALIRTRSIIDVQE